MLPALRRRGTASGPHWALRLVGIAGLTVLATACTTARATTRAPAGGERTATVSAQVATPISPTVSRANELCLACHSKPGIVRNLGHAQEALDAIVPEAFAMSAHGSATCTKCHPENSAVPHRSPAEGTPAFRTSDASQLCSSCHKEAAEGYAHTAHGVVSNLGDKRAPGCTDCHSVHTVKRVSEWSDADRGRACARCHEGADATFAQAATGHREASATWFAPTYFAGRFLVVLLACTLAFGTLHVELDMLRWGWTKVRSRHDGGKSE